MKIYLAGSTMLTDMEVDILKKHGKRLLSYHYIKEGGMAQGIFEKTKFMFEEEKKNGMDRIQSKRS